MQPRTKPAANAATDYTERAQAAECLPGLSGRTTALPASPVGIPEQTADPNLAPKFLWAEREGTMPTPPPARVRGGEGVLTG